MADEIRSVTPREAKKLSAFLAQQIDRELNKLAGVSRRSRVETASISNL
jgi:capsule polysaccharide export protein KpsE/RkpR